MSSSSADQTVSFKRGDTWQQRFEWIQKGNNQPVNLFGCDAKLDVVSMRGNEVVVSVSNTSSPSTLIIDGPNGIITLRVESEDTNSLSPGQYKADLQVTFPDGTVKSTNTFYVRVEEDVTR